MSKKRSRDDALDDISAWNTEGVLCLLRKVSEVRSRLTSRRSRRRKVGAVAVPRVGATSRRTPTVKGARRDRGNFREHCGNTGKREKKSQTHVRVKGGKYASIYSAARRTVRIAPRGRGAVGPARIPERFSGNRGKVTDPPPVSSLARGSSALLYRLSRRFACFQKNILCIEDTRKSRI